LFDWLGPLVEYATYKNVMCNYGLKPLVDQNTIVYYVNNIDRKTSIAVKKIILGKHFAKIAVN